MPSRVFLFSSANDRTLAVRCARAGEEYGRWTVKQLTEQAIIFYEVKHQTYLVEEIAPKHLYGTRLSSPVAIDEFLSHTGAYVIDPASPAHTVDAASVKTVQDYLLKAVL